MLETIADAFTYVGPGLLSRCNDFGLMRDNFVALPCTPDTIVEIASREAQAIAENWEVANG